VRIPAGDLFRVIAKEMSLRHMTFDAMTTGLLGWSFGRMGYCDPSVGDSLDKAIQNCFQSFKPGHYAQLSWALSQFRHPPKNGAKILARQSVWHLESVTLPQLSVAFWSMCIIGVMTGQVLQQYSDEIFRRLKLGGASPGVIAMLAQAFSSLPMSEQRNQFLSQILSVGILVFESAQQTDIKPQSLAGFVKSFASFNHDLVKPLSIFASDWLLGRQTTLSKEEFVEILSGINKLIRVEPNDERQDLKNVTTNKDSLRLIMEHGSHILDDECSFVSAGYQSGASKTLEDRLSGRSLVSLFSTISNFSATLIDVDRFPGNKLRDAINFHKESLLSFDLIKLRDALEALRLCELPEWRQFMFELSRVITSLPVQEAWWIDLRERAMKQIENASKHMPGGVDLCDVITLDSGYYLKQHEAETSPNRKDMRCFDYNLRDKKLHKMWKE